MKPIAFLLLAAAVASGAIAQDRDAYNLDAATADLAVFHKLARDGVLRREDAQADLNFGPRFDQADFNRDGMVTAVEMDKYTEQTYGISGSSASSERLNDAYRLHAATRDLEAFHQLAHGGMLKREDAHAHPFFGSRFDHVDLNRDGVITALEMDIYVRQTYQIVSNTAAGTSSSASVGSSKAGKSGSAPAGSGAASGSASAGSSRK